jgi:nitroimidazol reductase NimA-like FMN-containing flavoprotein (pyridoxamine 5'-phosphate oxidase superfamily)
MTSDHLGTSTRSADPTSAELFQLDRATCLALLATQDVGRLVVVEDGQPHLIPVNYSLVDGSVVFRRDDDGRASTTGPVVFEVDQLDGRTRSGWSVIARGSAHDLDAEEIGQLGERVTAWAPGLKERWIRIEVDEVTGRLLRGGVTPALDVHGYL